MLIPTIGTSILYVHEHLEVPLECDPIYEGQKLGVIYHRIDHQVGMEHFDPFYQYSIVLLILCVAFTLHTSHY